MICIELTAAVDSAGTTQTFYLSDAHFVTEATDTPAKTAFTSRLLQTGSLGRHVYSDGRTGGMSKLEIGDIIIANADGAYDGWINYSFDGRPIVIRQYTTGAYPASATPLLTGTADGIEASFGKLIVRLRDKSWVLDKPLLTAIYGGTNSLPSGLDGVAGDLKGKLRPKAYGVVYNVSPPCVNTSRLIYEVGSCNSVGAVYDRGAALTAGAAYTSQSDMETTAPAAGQYRAWPAGGYFRLGSAPSGQITADVTQGAAAANRTTAQIIKQIALDVGVASGDISSADVAALDVSNSAVVGLWVDVAETALKLMDRVAASIGAWYGFDNSGALRMGRLEAPATAIFTYYDHDIGERIERRMARDKQRPVWRVTLGYERNWTPQASDLAGAVTDARRGWLREEERIDDDSDAAVKTQWLMAEELRVTGLLTAAADAATESARLLTLHKTRRDVFDVPLPATRAASVDLGDSVALVLPRFGMTGGKNFRVIGIRHELMQNTIILTLWG